MLQAESIWVELCFLRFSNRFHEILRLDFSVFEGGLGTRLEKLDQLLEDAKSVISLSHERLYDKKTKQKLLSLTSLWKKPAKEEEEKDLQDYVSKQTTFDTVLF